MGADTKPVTVLLMKKSHATKARRLLRKNGKPAWARKCRQDDHSPWCANQAVCELRQFHSVARIIQDAAKQMRSRMKSVSATIDRAGKAMRQAVENHRRRLEG